jgi:hypothetical protein
MQCDKCPESGFCRVLLQERLGTGGAALAGWEEIVKKIFQGRYLKEQAECQLTQWRVQ